MKTLELTTEELTQASQALAELMQESRPFRLGLALRRLARQVEPAVQDAASLEREIIERYARKDEHGEWVSGRDAEGEVQPGTVELSNPRACFKALEALRRTRVKVHVEPLTLEDFQEAGPDVPPRVLLALGALLEDEAPRGASGPAPAQA